MTVRRGSRIPGSAVRMLPVVERMSCRRMIQRVRVRRQVLDCGTVAFRIRRRSIAVLAERERAKMLVQVATQLCLEATRSVPPLLSQKENVARQLLRRGHRALARIRAGRRSRGHARRQQRVRVERLSQMQQGVRAEWRVASLQPVAEREHRRVLLVLGRRMRGLCLAGVHVTIRQQPMLMNRRYVRCVTCFFS